MTHLLDFSWWAWTRHPPRGGAPGAVGFPVQGLPDARRGGGWKGTRGLREETRGWKSGRPVGVPT